MSQKSSLKVFSRFNLPPSPSLECKDASLTRQEFVQESDINNIMRKFSKGLPPSPPGSRPPMFGDFSELPDYQSALNTVIQANEAFEALPARVRERFGNDPAQVLDFLADENNRQEAIDLGLLEKPVEVVRSKNDVVSSENDLEKSQSPKGEA